jgi:hypothetical protein
MFPPPTAFILPLFVNFISGVVAVTSPIKATA